MTPRVPHIPRTSSVFVLLFLALLLTITFVSIPSARAEGLPDDGSAEWHLEQPAPPKREPEEPALTPIGLGAIGDVEFSAPNRGLLITAGNGSAIPPGVWTYDGTGWHEFASKCGATDGRIAWAGADEFWTISDGRPGQALEAEGRTPPLEDDTLCHFAPPPGNPSGQIEIVASYASLAFQASSYQPMHAAGCIGPTDCWFAGNPLPEPQIGAFQLHWNGSSLTAEPNPQGYPVQDMRPFEGSLYESVQLSLEDPVTTKELEPAVLHRINPAGVLPEFFSVPPEVPHYGPEEFPEALGALHLSADSEALWGAANPVPENELPEGSEPGEVTVVRDAGGHWSQVIGFSEPSQPNPLAGYVVDSIAAEPGSESAWVALDTPSDAENPSPTAPAVLARVSSTGVLSDLQTLPSAEETAAGVGPKGAAEKITCPAAHDCWMTTSQGWLFHLAPASERSLPKNEDPGFVGPVITYRPPDEGVPQEALDAPPPDDSGLSEEAPNYGGTFAETKAPPLETKVSVALLSNIHSRLLAGDTLELRFHLAAKARVRLLAERHKKLVASTPMHTFAAGTRKLLLRLNPHDWPTKLALQTHALAPLPTVTAKEPVGGPEHGGAGSNTVSTGLVVLPRAPFLTGSGFRP
jgi:hypothetical protein